MTSDSSRRVWIDPPRYYSATAAMTQEEVRDLLAQIESCAEDGRWEELKKFDFVLTENPYVLWQRDRCRQNPGSIKTIESLKSGEISGAHA